MEDVHSDPDKIAGQEQTLDNVVGQVGSGTGIEADPLADTGTSLLSPDKQAQLNSVMAQYEELKLYVANLEKEPGSADGPNLDMYRGMLSDMEARIARLMGLGS